MSNAQKIPLAPALDKFTRTRIQDQIQLTGKALPAQVVAVDGAIITVKFLLSSLFTLPQIDCPLFGPEYIRYPIQVGDLGVVFPSDFYLGGVSGLGGGEATLRSVGNLAALVFFPIGNKTWFSVDPDQVTIYGPNGVKLMDTGETTTFVLTPTGVVITCADQFQVVTGSCTFHMASDGTYSLTGVSGAIEATTLALSDGAHSTSPTIMNTAYEGLLTWLAGHIHSDPQGGNTGVPTTSPPGGNIAP